MSVFKCLPSSDLVCFQALLCERTCLTDRTGDKTSGTVQLLFGKGLIVNDHMNIFNFCLYKYKNISK